MGGLLRIRDFTSPIVPTSLDPAEARWGFVTEQLYEGLVRLSPRMDIVPVLAEYWILSEDGRRMTFILKRGVRFHNGRELTAQDAKISFAFARRGVIPGFGSHVTVARVAGLSNAAELMMSGRTMRGSEAAVLGLASKALPAAEVLPAAIALARDIAENSAPVAVAIIKHLLWQHAAATPAEMKRREDRLFAWIGAQPDAREGIEAFLEKRNPRWSMSVNRDLPDSLE